MSFLIPVPNGRDDYRHIDDGRSAKGILVADCITAETAAAVSGYHIQYIRRLAYDGKLEAVHVGRAWLISLPSLQRYLKRAQRMPDARYGPRKPATLSEITLRTGIDMESDHRPE